MSNRVLHRTATVDPERNVEHKGRFPTPALLEAAYPFATRPADEEWIALVGTGQDRVQYQATATGWEPTSTAPTPGLHLDNTNTATPFDWLTWPATAPTELSFGTDATFANGPLGLAVGAEGTAAISGPIGGADQCIVVDFEVAPAPVNGPTRWFRRRDASVWGAWTRLTGEGTTPLWTAGLELNEGERFLALRPSDGMLFEYRVPVGGGALTAGTTFDATEEARYEIIGSDVVPSLNQDWLELPTAAQLAENTAHNLADGQVYAAPAPALGKWFAVKLRAGTGATVTGVTAGAITGGNAPVYFQADATGTAWERLPAAATASGVPFQIVADAAARLAVTGQAVGDLVKEADTQGTYAWDGTQWEWVRPPYTMVHAWQPNHDYQTDQLVQVGDDIWRATAAFTSNGTDFASEPVGNWSIIGGGQATNFASEAVVAPAAAGNPTLLEISTFAANNGPLYDRMIRYTGTDTVSDPITKLYFVDRIGQAVLVNDYAAQTDTDYQPATAYNANDVVLSAIPAGSANGTAGQLARYERIAAGTSGGGTTQAMDLAEEANWNYLGAVADTYAALSDTDMTGIQDGDSVFWSQALNRWVPGRTERFWGHVATFADVLLLTGATIGDEVYEAENAITWKLIGDGTTADPTIASHWERTGEETHNPKAFSTDKAYTTQKAYIGS